MASHQLLERLKKRVHRIRLATINIGTFTGCSRELADALKTRRIDIACIQETRWKGSKARDIGEGYKLLYHGVRSSQNGVGMAISKRLRESVVEVNNISDRLISVKIVSGPTTIRVVSCYAPQVGCLGEEKDAFWESLDTHLQMVAPEKHILVGGDLNSHVGSDLSPLLFITCMDTATADLQAPYSWSLLYAVDVFLTGRERQDLQDQTQHWKDRLDVNGLQLNLDKTEYMEYGPQTDDTIRIEGRDLKKATQFKYLGSTLSADGDSLPDTRSRVNTAWLKWRQVTGVLCDRRMPNHLKAKVYKTVVRPVALYGAECWPASTRHEQALHVMEMHMLRWTLGLTRWDQVMNEDVRKIMGVTPIMDKMREARLQWYSHAVGVEESTAPQPRGKKKPCGRPKKWWMDQIKEDMRHVNTTPEDALDRKKWRATCRKADPATTWDKH
ncbi:uncharacterized protein LOC127452701 [Myxocyprinus asiaticus]|uniref:uncharacterized protein LOC127452701 n=1 Tax=Myxocyprinus asiaticus TaxID=70543 RepID=UPI0022213E25|nr:uncharacterized protein LOC127452701 [Myxocyprinus asiaticus]